MADNNGKPSPIPKDLVAASATPIVLALLSREESYGYAIIQTVKAVSDNRMAWTDGMLYPVLHRLESAGFVTARWGRSETGRKRKYYRATDAGETELLKLKEQWQVVQDALARIEGGL